MQSALGERRWRLHARILKDNWYRLLPNAATLELHPTMPIDGSIRPLADVRQVRAVINRYTSVDSLRELDAATAKSLGTHVA